MAGGSGTDTFSSRITSGLDRGGATHSSSSLGSSCSLANAAGMSSAALASDSELSAVGVVEETLVVILSVGALLLLEHSKE